MVQPWLIIGLGVFVAYSVEAATGFGSIVIAMSLGALLLPIHELVPVLVPLNILMSFPMVWLLRDKVHWALLGKQILPLMALGTALGLSSRHVVDDAWLKRAFGALIVWFAARSLWLAYRQVQITPHKSIVSHLLTIGAGITHGLFASGGPLLVYGLAGMQLDKARFRATLLALWGTLNGSLTLWFLFRGELAPAAPRIAMLSLGVLCGALFGNWLHHRIDEARFRQAVFAVLLLTGTLLLAR